MKSPQLLTRSVACLALAMVVGGLVSAPALMQFTPINSGPSHATLIRVCDARSTPPATIPTLRAAAIVGRVSNSNS